MRELTVTTQRRTQLLDITDDVRGAVEGAGGAAVLVYVPHTTAGLTINEHADPAVARDFEAALERIVGDGLGLAARRGGRGERAVAHPGRADGAAGGDPAAGGPAGARDVAGNLLLRARRAAHALRLCERPRVETHG